MMERNGNVIRSVAWAELFPWLIIFKTFRLAIGFRSLAMSALAVLLMATGWAVIGHIFSTEEASTSWLKSFAGCPWKELVSIVPDKPDLFGGVPPAAIDIDAAAKDIGAEKALARTTQKMAEQSKSSALHEPLTGSWSLLNQPLWNGFDIKVTFGNTLCLICCGLCAAAIWAFFGAAITRIAAVQLAANERITWGAALRFACAKFFAYFCAPLLPLGAVAVVSLLVLSVGWLLWFNFGAFVVGTFVWPLFLIGGLTIALLLVGLVFGWPLMWPTISTEGSDSFDALSRSYAAVYQRPLHYLFYVAVASLLGLLGWLFVKNFTAAAVWTTYWAASWGAGAGRIQELMNATHSGEKLAGMAYAGAWMIHFWTGLAKLFAVGFSFSFFWNAYSAIYLLLRRDVDATEMDEVYLDADEGEAKFGLPKIVLDDAGAPEVEEKAASTEEKAPAKQESTPDAASPAEGGDGASKPSTP
ncbi:MAG: hypothetical protein IT426_11045 [Pirellulales bacterium]|nr:hypothetical protein [Pirellulales bacterium]